MRTEIVKVIWTSIRGGASTRGAALILGLSLALVANADEPEKPDPEVARLNAEAARLTAETALLAAQSASAAARFGAAATPIEGTITGADKFSAMSHWTLSAATTAVAEHASTALLEKVIACGSGDVLVTSSEDRRAAALTAKILENRLTAFTGQLKDALAAASPLAPKSRMLALTQTAAVKGLVGTIDSLVGMFRTNYTFTDLDVAANDLALRIELSRELSKKLNNRPIVVDGLASPASTSGLIATYDRFDSERQLAQQRYAKAFAAAKNDAEKTALAGVKSLLEGAAALDTALTTPAGGQVPIVSIALAVPIANSKACVVYVKFGAYSASLVTRKKLMSRNDSVVAIAGGAVNYALFDTNGVMTAADTLSLDERIGGKLSDIVRSAKGISRSKTQITPTPES
jgi:hypothetical protein